MAIQLNAPDLSGLSRLAGGGGSNLNLSVPGALGLQSLQVSNAAQNAALDRRSQDERALMAQGIQQQQMNQQGLLANQQNQLDRDKMAQLAYQFDVGAGMDRDKLAAAMGQQDRSMGLDERKVALAEQELQQKQQATEMAKLLDMNSAKLKQIGAHASYGLLAIKGAKTPEEANTIRVATVQEALDNKFITKEQAAAALKMPISQYTGSLMQSVMGAGMAKEYKDMASANAPVKESTGIHIGRDEMGNITSVTQDASTPVKSQLQKDLIYANDNLKELNNMYSKVTDEMFGPSALNQSATWVREWAEKVPVVGKLIGPAKEEKDSLELYSAIQSQSNNLAMNVIKQLSGLSYTDKQLSFLSKILPEVGPTAVRSEFEGRSKNLERFFNTIKQDRETLLQNGIDVGSPAYKELMLSKMQNAAISVSSPDYLFDQYRKLPEYKNVSDSELRKRIQLLGNK